MPFVTKNAQVRGKDNQIMIVPGLLIIWRSMKLHMLVLSNIRQSRRSYGEQLDQAHLNRMLVLLRGDTIRNLLLYDHELDVICF